MLIVGIIQIVVGITFVILTKKPRTFRNGLTRILKKN